MVGEGGSEAGAGAGEGGRDAGGPGRLKAGPAIPMNCQGRRGRASSLRSADSWDGAIAIHSAPIIMGWSPARRTADACVGVAITGHLGGWH